MFSLKRFLGLGEGSSDLLDFDSASNVYSWTDSVQPQAIAVAPTELPPAPTDIYVWSNEYHVAQFNASIDVGPNYISEQVSLWGADGKSSGITTPDFQAWQSGETSYGWNYNFTQGPSYFAESYSQYNSRTVESGFSTSYMSAMSGASESHSSSFSLFGASGWLSISESELNGTSAWSSFRLGTTSVYASFGQFHQTSSSTTMGDSWYSTTSAVTDALWQNQGIETPSFGMGSSVYAEHSTYDGFSYNLGRDGRLLSLSVSYGESNLLTKSDSQRVGDVSLWATKTVADSHGDSFAVWQEGFLREHYDTKSVSWDKGVSTLESGFEMGGSITKAHDHTELVLNQGPIVREDIDTDTLQFDLHQSGWENTLGGQRSGYQDFGGFVTKTTEVDHYADGHLALITQYAASMHSESYGSPDLLSHGLSVPQDMAVQLVGVPDHGLLMM